MSTIDLKLVLEIVKSSPLFDTVRGVQRELRVIDIVAMIVTGLKGEVVRYVPARKVLVFANPKGAIWFNQTGNMYFYDGIKVHENFTTKSPREVLDKVFEVLKELTEELVTESAAEVATEGKALSMVDIAMSEVLTAFEKLETAMMQDFQQTLGSYSKFTNPPQLSYLNSEIASLQDRLEYLQALKEETSRLTDPTAYRGRSKQPEYLTLDQPQLTRGEIAAKVASMVGGNIFTLQAHSPSAVLHAFDYACEAIREHHPRLAGLIPSAVQPYEDRVTFLMRVMQNGL